MAEVGVLELKIKDNSKAAGDGLKNLAKGLTAVKEAMQQFDLSPVGRQITGLAKTISDQKGASTTIKNLSGLFNAVSKFSQLKSFKIDTQPFENLRDALKDGFKIGQAGTQLNQLREAITGDWGDGSGVQVLTDLHTAAQNLSGDAEGIKATTDAIKEAAASLKSINSYSNAAAGSDWRMGMSGVSEGKSAGADVSNGMAEGVEQNKSVAVAAAVALAQAIIEAAKSTLEIASPSKVMQQIGEYAGEGLTEGLLSKQPGVEQAATSISDTIANAVSKFKTSEFNRFTTPVENLTNTFISLNKAQEAYASGIDAVLPKIQAMSSEEMIVAGNARQAQDAIERIVERLNKPIKYKNLADMINASQGIGKQPLNAEVSAQVYKQIEDLTRAQEEYNESLEGMDKQPFSGVVKVFDQAVGAYHEIKVATNDVGEKFDQLSGKAQEVRTSIEQARQSAINLSEIPATGMNGTFNNAAEELTYLTEKIEEAKNSMQFWADTYEKTQKQIKFNGPSEERTNMLQHAEDGFYQAIESMEAYQAALTNTMTALTAYIADMRNAAAATNTQAESMREAAEAANQVNEAMGQSTLADQAAQSNEQLQNVVSSVQEVQNSAATLNAVSESADNLQRSYGMEMVDNLVNCYNAIELMELKMQGMKQALADDINQNKVDTQQIAERTMAIQNLADKIEELRKKQEEAEASTGNLGEKFKAFGKAVKGLFPGITGLFKRLKSLIIMRTLRYLIREVAKGFSEGVNNVYEYSKAVGNSFGPAMDSVKSKLETMKNSVGAAVAPVLNALIPILNSLADAAITCFNYINQLFALLTGQAYWTKAKDGAEDYTKEAKKAGGATKEWLASFDELNVMSSGGGGGGGSGIGDTDYKDMFENVTAFDKKIRQIADYIQEHMTSILGIAGAIATAILAWKLSETFANTLPLLSNIAGLIGTGAVIAITLQATWMLDNLFLDTGEQGWLLASVLTTALGSTAAWAIAKKLIGGKAGVYAAAITLAFSAATDIIANIKKKDVSALDAKSIELNLKAALEAGAALGVVLKSATTMGTKGILMKSGGLALITFGVATGLKAITDKEHTKWDDFTKIKEVIKSAAPVGLGLAAMGASPALAIGGALTFAVFVALGVFTKREKIDWGDLDLTEDQIKKFVLEKMFDTPVDIKITKINAIIGDKETASENIRSAITDIGTEYNLLQLGIDTETSYGNIQTLIGDENSGLIKQVSDLCNANISLLKLTFSSIEIYDGEGNVMDSKTLLSGATAWNKVKSQMEADGKELSQLLGKGAKGELTPQMEKYTEELLQKVMSLASKLANAEEYAKSVTQFRTAALKAMNENSFQGIIDAFKTYSSDYETTIRTQIMQTIEDWYKLAEIEDDPELKATYKQIADDMSAGFERTVQEELKKRTSPGRQMILDWLFENNPEPITGDNFKEFLNGLFTGNLAETLYDALLQSGLLAPEEIDVMRLIGFSGWDMLSEELQNQFLDHVQVSITTIAEMGAMGIPAEKVIEITNWDKITETEKTEFINAIIQAYGGSSIEELKKKFPTIKATDIVNIGNWNTFTIAQKFEFLNAVKDAFGAQEAMNAAKQAGIDLEAFVRQGMASGNEDIRTQAAAWNKIIDEQMQPEHKVTVGADSTSTQTAAQTINGSIATIVTNFWDNLKKKMMFKPPAANQPQVEVKDAVEAVDTNNAFGTEVQNEMKSSVEDTTGTITAEVDAADVVDVDFKKLGKDVKKDWEDTISKSMDSDAAHQKTKKAGNNIGDNLKAGMNEKNSIIEQQAQEWWDLIDGKLKVEHIIKIKEDKQNIETVKKNIKTDIEKLQPTITVQLTGPLYDFQREIEWLVKPTVTAAFTGDYEGFTNTIQSNVTPTISSLLGEPTEKQYENLEGQIQSGVKPTITVNLVAGDMKDFTNSVMRAVAAGVNGVKVKIEDSEISLHASYTLLANGGLVNSGDIFVANENGRAEMIGRFGNQAAVANQEQMVEAMARGVQYANADQNAILRQQNELLRAILRKENTLKIGASTALGRVARQSINMYENAAGV